jgi:hypothetical protein
MKRVLVNTLVVGGLSCCLLKEINNGSGECMVMSWNFVPSQNGTTDTGMDWTLETRISRNVAHPHQYSCQ